jgi:hypothetical protein
VRLVGHGHPAIRATHAKTLELTPEHELTERGTCVVAVGTVPVAAPMAGPVRITISAGGESFAFEARANPLWDPTGRAVVRRGPLRLAGTLATHATATSADLPRPLVEALRDPHTVVEIELTRIPGPPTAVLFALAPDTTLDAALAAELAAADLVCVEDEDAARRLGERVTRGPVAVDRRVLVIAERELPGRLVTDALGRVELDTVGLPARLAAAAASPSRAPLVLAPDGAELRDLLRSTPATHRLVVAVDGSGLVDLLTRAARERGVDGAVLAQPAAPPVRVSAADPAEISGTVYCCLDAAGASDAVDPPVRAAVDALLADGVSTRTAAKALAALTGWERRRAYDAVVGWRAT